MFMILKSAQLDIDCIMPAAGLSSRMGAWKLMLPYCPDSKPPCTHNPDQNESTIVEESVKNALAVCSRVILVAGYRAEELIEKMRAYPNVEVVVNQHYQQGMFSSIKLAMQHVRSDYFFIAHGDMPCISADIYQQLWQARGLGTVFPGSEKHSGHPVLINAALKQPIIDASENSSMKANLKLFPISYLKLADDNIHFDIDTPDAYQKLCDKQK